MTDISNASSVTVRTRNVRAAGLRRNGVVAFDWGFAWRGEYLEQRSFVLLEEGFQLSRPPNFPAVQRGWWYCDLVRVTDNGDEVVVDDLWIDVIVGPPDHPYRVLDLDEYGEAMAQGKLGAAEGVDGLVRTQRFLDRRLNRRDDAGRTWPEFPPAEVVALMDASFERAWTPV
jgi:hypothetical protein